MAKDRKQKKREEQEAARRRIAKFKGMIRKFDDPILSQVCDPVDPSEDLSWLRILRQVCLATENGVGLAASQVGLAKRAMFVMPKRDKQRYLLNVEIISASDEMDSDIEGCLSYPGYSGMVLRPKSITIRALQVDVGDETFTPRQIEETIADPWESRVVQHEHEHTLGICRVAAFWRQANGGVVNSTTNQSADQSAAA